VGDRVRICTITVRGGSKGVPGKNWREFAGMPLFAHSVRQALDSQLFDRVAVTSDAAPVLDTAAEFGATDVVVRPPELATDTAGKVPSIAHAVVEVEKTIGQEFDTVVDLDATSPLRDLADIAGALELFDATGADSVITGSPSHRSPYFNLVEVDPQTGTVAVSKPPPPGLLRRQDVPPTFDMNASIYVWKRDILVSDPRVFYASTRLFEMPPERSHDIDSELDFELVSWLWHRKEQN